jgi:hypothetical protein
MKQKQKMSATKSTQTINNDNKEIIPGYTKQMLEDIGIKIVTYRKQYYIDNREYILNKSSLRYHESKLSNEPVITAIDRFINSI